MLTRSVDLSRIFSKNCRITSKRERFPEKIKKHTNVKRSPQSTSLSALRSIIRREMTIITVTIAQCTTLKTENTARKKSTQRRIARFLLNLCEREVMVRLRDGTIIKQQATIIIIDIMNGISIVAMKSDVGIEKRV